MVCHWGETGRHALTILT